MKNSPLALPRRRFVVNAVLIFICLSLALILFPAFRRAATSRAGQKEEISPSAIRFSENFDSAPAPALPVGWTTSATGASSPFATAPANPDSPPNALFTNNPAFIGSAEITSPPVALGNSRAVLTFRHSYATESRMGYDGGVLEISVAGGAFQDILAAGATFAGGGYIQAISSNATGNPLMGRLAWTGDSRGYATTIVHLPTSMTNQTVRFRWRYATDNTFDGTGWRIDNVKVEDLSPRVVGFSENFDGVNAPQLPAGWTTEQSEPIRAFVTHTEFEYSAPNSVFTPAPATAGTAAIISPSIRIGSNAPKLTFQHFYAVDAGRKGGVLEISINGGAFQDILAAGGSFVHGGYSGTLNAGNPLPNRQAWTGSTNSFILTEVNLPPAAYRQNVRFRWLFATDLFILSVGWWIDNIQVSEAIAGENLNVLSIPASGVANPYPSEIQVANLDDLITGVQVNLINFSHASPDDVDLLLVSPSGRKVVLMSDVGGGNPVSNLSLSFEDSAANDLPDNAPLASGNYRPTNFEPATDNFPAPAPPGATTGNKLSVLNGSEPNGVWKLFLVDDNGNNAGSISGGWNLSLQTSPDVIAIPTSGTSQPYPSEFNVSGLPGSLSKVTVNLSNFSHTSPDDVDIMLVAPNGRRIVLMSDVGGGGTEVGGLNITLSDDAAANLPDNAPLASGAYKPTNFEPGDAFPAPAPQGATTGTTLGAFFGISPNGVWRLYVVDDAGENLGSIAGNWTLNIQSSIGACQFSLSSNAQAFPLTGGSGGFSVLMPTGCPWTATSNSNFIALTAGSSGEGDGAVAFSVAANQGPARTGTITVTNGAFSRTFQVQQASGCPFSVNQSIMNFSASGGAGSVQVTAGAECSWQTSASASWIFVTSSPQTGNGTAAFTVQPNPSANARSATITIGAQVITVNQAGASGKRFDFDGDNRADISVFRPAGGNWYLLQSTDGFTAAQFGVSTDKPVPADYDGDRKTDIAVFRQGSWYLLQSSDASFRSIQFGVSTDKPVPADYNGDGRAELAVYRNGDWHTLDLTGNQASSVQFGLSNDKPVPADYDGDGKTDQAVYRDGSWYLLRSTQGFTGIQFGISTDKPVPADYDGDGKTDQAVYREGNWYINRSLDGQFSGAQFGIATDVPAPADYDGDGKTDIAVYRDGNWYLLSSQSGAFSAVQFGVAGDLPVPSVFMP